MDTKEIICRLAKERDEQKICEALFDFYIIYEGVDCNMTIPELREIAIDNIRREGLYLTDLGNILFTKKTQILSLSGKHGASAILDSKYMMKIYEMIGDYYIIPSSINEVLIVPKSLGYSKDRLQDILININMSIRSKMVLSNQIISFKELITRL